MKADKLIRACQGDTAILTSTLGWIEEEEDKTIRRMVMVENHVEIYRLQGEARALRKLRDSLVKLTKGKDDKSGKIKD